MKIHLQFPLLERAVKMSQFLVVSREHGCQQCREEEQKRMFGGNGGLKVGGSGDLKFVIGVTISEQDSLRQFSELDFED